MMISKLITGLSTTIFSIPIALSGRLDIARLSCDFLRSICASSESLSYRVHDLRRILTFACLLYCSATYSSQLCPDATEQIHLYAGLTAFTQ